MMLHAARSSWPVRGQRERTAWRFLFESSLSARLPRQSKHPANPGIHERTIEREISKATAGQIGVLASGVGTGETITEISRYTNKTEKRKIVLVAVELEKSPVLNQRLAGEDLKAGSRAFKESAGPSFLTCSICLWLIGWKR